VKGIPVAGIPCLRRRTIGIGSLFRRLRSRPLSSGGGGLNHMARVRFEKAILEAQCDVEIVPGVVLSAGRHTAVLRQQIIISTLSGPGREPPRFPLGYERDIIRRN
jgi:hypothetical protein